MIWYFSAKKNPDAYKHALGSALCVTHVMYSLFSCSIGMGRNDIRLDMNFFTLVAIEPNAIWFITMAWELARQKGQSKACVNKAPLGLVSTNGPFRLSQFVPNWYKEMLYKESCEESLYKKTSTWRGQLTWQLVDYQCALTMIPIHFSKIKRLD